MKVFFQKYKKDFWIIVTVFSFLLVLLVARIVSALDITVAETIIKEDNVVEKPDETLWQNAEAQVLQKEIYWLEQQLVLAKSDSISLGINLTDSIVQVQLKGTILFQAKILQQTPVNFMNLLNEDAYLAFARINRIEKEFANIPKRPVKKVVAPKNESEVIEVKHDSIPEVTLNWKFLVENNINVVINGAQMNEDSLFQVNASRDVLKYRNFEFIQQVIPNSYSPTLFLWVNDKEAKAIYRAIPENGKVIFRN
jgi:hypothetical protein